MTKAAGADKVCLVGGRKAFYYCPTVGSNKPKAPFCAGGYEAGRFLTSNLSSRSISLLEKIVVPFLSACNIE